MSDVEETVGETVPESVPTEVENVVPDAVDETAEFVSPEDLKAILDAKQKSREALAAFDKVATEARSLSLEAKNADLSYQVVVQHVFLKNGLSMADSISDESGLITRKVAE